MAEDKRENAMHVIAVDAMGGDNAPQAIVEGVNQAIADFKDIEIQRMNVRALCILMKR